MPPNSSTAPPGVIRPILRGLISVNHRLPSGPAVICSVFEFGVMPFENSVIVGGPASATSAPVHTHTAIAMTAP